MRLSCPHRKSVEPLLPNNVKGVRRHFLRSPATEGRGQAAITKRKITKISSVPGNSVMTSPAMARPRPDRNPLAEGPGNHNNHTRFLCVTGRDGFHLVWRWFCWREPVRGADVGRCCVVVGLYPLGVALVASRGLPTLEDARRAAVALGEALDPGEVLLFGSVAQGAQAPGSDLDLVLVFDDLGDYSDRRSIADRARQTVRGATGFGCDVRVTDRPEWEVRAKRCRSTFEAHIASHAVTLASRPPRGGIDWDKEIGMAPSDAEQAARSLNNVVNALTKLMVALEPSTRERDALWAGDLYEADSWKRARLLSVCEQSQTAIETSLKALIHALEGDHPGKVHGIGQLLDAAGAHLSGPETDRLAACLGSISPEDASVWRVAGTYPDDLDIAGDPDAATDEFSAQMAKAAADMAHTCIGLIEHQLGLSPPAASQALNRVSQIHQELPNLDPGRDASGSEFDIGL